MGSLLEEFERDVCEHCEEVIESHHDVVFHKKTPLHYWCADAYLLELEGDLNA